MVLGGANAVPKLPTVECVGELWPHYLIGYHHRRFNLDDPNIRNGRHNCLETNVEETKKKRRSKVNQVSIVISICSYLMTANNAPLKWMNELKCSFQRFMRCRLSDFSREIKQQQIDANFIWQKLWMGSDSSIVCAAMRQSKINRLFCVVSLGSFR